MNQRAIVRLLPSCAPALGRHPKLSGSLACFFVASGLLAFGFGMASAYAVTPGSVLAWGYNDFGQTTVPAGLIGVTAIAAGHSHTLALKTDGTVVAWGAGKMSTGSNEEYGQSIVPVGLSGVTAIAAGVQHSVALKNDGTVVTWGGNQYGQASVPGGLNGVTAIAAVDFQTLALKSDGTVVAWGYNAQGQTTVPAGLSGVTAIAAGGQHSLALKSDGTVVAWGRNDYGETTVPTGLSGVTAIAAGGLHSVVMKSDGTVMAWGYNVSGQTTVPTGLSDVTAIAAGRLHTVALKSDGMVVAWGNNGQGQTTLPVELNGVRAIAAGNYHTAAILTLRPTIFAPPVSQVVTIGQNATFAVTATGAPPLAYQWRKGGTNLVGAMGTSYSLTGVTTNHAGSYTVVVSNSAGSITSAPPAVLTVNRLNQGITFGPLPGKFIGDAPFSLGATASSSLPVNYTSSNPDVATVSGSTVTVSSVGTTTINAFQAGDATYLPATSGSQTLTVSRLSQTISFAAMPTKFVGDAPFALGATASSSLPVSYISSNPGVATVSGNTVTIVGAGTTILTAAQAGDATYQPATSVPQTLTVSRLGQTISFAVLPTKFVGSAPFALGATASSGLSVSYVSSNPSVATVSWDNVTIVGAGTTVLTAAQAGDATYQPATPVARTLTVNPVPASVSAQPQSQTVNSGTTVSFTVSASGTAPFAYQWRTNGVDINGATSQTLTLANVTTAKAASYTVRVSNAGGSAVSDLANLTVFNITVDGLAAGPSIIRSGPALVAVSSYFPGGFLFYTLDGSAPTTSSTLYSGPFILPSSATVRVLALSSDFLQSVPGPAVAVQIVPFYSVSLTTPGGGSATVSPAQASYPSNTVVTLTATPDAGWTFLRWEGTATSTNNPLALTLNAAQTVRAIFGTPVARSAVGGGSVEFEPERAAHDFGSTLRAKALPNAGNKFVLWSGALSGITNGLDLTVTQPGLTASALFTALAGNEFSLVALPVGPGTVTLNPHKNAYTLGEVVQLTATADGTNQFLGWTGDLSGTASPVDVTMNASKRVTAFFGQPVPPFIVTQPQGATVLAGTNLTLAVEASGPPLGFQWFHRGQSLAGATNTTLSLPNITRAQGGIYYVQVTNLTGATNSSNAVVRVLAPTLFLPPEFSVGTPLRLRFGNSGIGGVLTTNDAGNFEIHVSTNLAGTNWLRLNVPLTVTNGQIVFEDGESVSLPRRFYRVIER